MKKGNKKEKKTVLPSGKGRLKEMERKGKRKAKHGETKEQTVTSLGPT